MKLTVSTILFALVLASMTQVGAVPVTENREMSRRHVGPGQLAEGFAAGLQSFASEFGHFGADASSANAPDQSRNAAVSTSSSSSSESATSGSAWVGPLTSLTSSPTSSPSSSQSSSSSSSAPSSSASSSNGGNSGSGGTGFNDSPLAGKTKLGLAWPNGGSMNIKKWMTDKVSWYYSWSETPGWKNAPTNITFCPMLWGRKNVGQFRQHVLENPNGKYNQAKCVLTMNEPNQKGQADMSVYEACGLMRSNILPLKRQGWYVVSPATTSAPSGEKWMENFRSTCPDVWRSIDAVAVHFYDTSTRKFQNYVNRWYNRFEKPIWVTEYACQNFNGGAQCSQSKAQKFHIDMADWFDQQDFVEAYSPFGVMQNLQDVSGTNRMANGQNPSPLFNTIAS